MPVFKLIYCIIIDWITSYFVHFVRYFEHVCQENKMPVTNSLDRWKEDIFKNHRRKERNHREV